MQASSASPRDAASGKWFTVADSAGPALWAALIALLGNGIAIAWWHPYCDHQSDGPGSFATGFPLPYAQTLLPGAFSYMPHVWLVNVAFVALIAYPIFRWVFRRGASRSKLVIRGASLTGLILFGLIGYFNVFLFSELGFPVWSIADPDRDSYWSYRPSMIAIASGHKECFYGGFGLGS